ncbi:hypothetical protein DL98DRAFT_576410 [Cadophora sp. DSE1049]|nr:hypothetical protein DL98DRAFT_576410 [Cadophora sp. DSE1049]
MVREGFPPISRPLPVLLQGLEYDDIPVEPKPKEISTFEKPSLSYSWLHNLWTNIISAKWAGNLLAVTSESSAPVQISHSLSYNSGPPNDSLISNPKRPSSGNWHVRDDLSRKSRPRTLDPLPRLSWTDWRAEDLLRVVSGSLPEEEVSPVVNPSSDGATLSMVDKILREFVEDALLQADDLEEIDFWTSQFAVDSDLLRKAIDCNLFKVNSPAWETLAYLLGEECKIEDARKLYLEGQNSIRMLGLSLLACEIEDPRVSLALWRIWAYCILSVDSMVAGECIAIQVAWLRGPTVDRAMLGKPRLDSADGNWKLCRRNGIFAQSNNDIKQSDVDDMIQIWDLLRQKWLEVMTGKVCDDEG